VPAEGEGGMTDERGPYSRHYWKLIDDPKFVDVFDNDHHYACWSRLLMLADQAWPASAHIPASARKSSVAKLAQVELILLLPGGRFRMIGTQAEREKRSHHAAHAAASRWGTVSNAESNAPSIAAGNAHASGGRMPSKAEQEQSKEEQHSTPRAPDPADAYWSLTGKYPNGGALSWIDDMSASYGPDAVVRAVAKAHLEDKAVSTLLGRAQDILRSEARALSLKEQANVRQTLKERRAAPRADIDPEVLAAEIRRIREEAA
jgi:hypothetical protein